MLEKIKTSALALAGVAALGAAGVGVADAAKVKHSTKTTTKSTAAKAGNSAETVLTGDTKASAESAALAAVPGGTVERSSTEDPSDASGAAYEVHVTKADGSRVEVLEDSSFKVLSTKADAHGGHRGHDGGPANEPALTGATKSSAESAALAAVPGGTVERSSAEDPSDASGAAYEVHVTKADGSRVEVLEDSSFKVLSTKADTHAGRHG